MSDEVLDVQYGLMLSNSEMLEGILRKSSDFVEFINPVLSLSSIVDNIKVYIDTENLGTAIVVDQVYEFCYPVTFSGGIRDLWKFWEAVCNVVVYHRNIINKKNQNDD